MRRVEHLPALRRRLAESENVILESTSILKFVSPDLYLTVLDPATADFKRSAQEFLDQADAVILHAPKEATNTGKAAWTGISLKPVAGCPIFEIHPPEYVTPEIAEFVRSAMSDLKPEA